MVELVQITRSELCVQLLYSFRFNFIYGLRKKTIKGNLVIGFEPMSSGLWAQRAVHCAIQEFPPLIPIGQKRFNFIYGELMRNL
jgi:hypothetical protein